MNYKQSMFRLILLVSGLFLITACSTTSPDIAQLRGELSEKNREIRTLSSENAQKEGEIASLKESNFSKDRTIEQYREKLNTQTVGESAALLPPQAKPGECYARVFVPPTYRTETKQVVTREKSERLEISPAKYGWGEEKVLVKEASERIVVEPAQYKWAEERIMVKPASKKLVEVPAKYGWTEEKILVKEAHTTWKKGRGPIEKVDHSTGEIMCLVEVPASYRTVKRRTLLSGPSTREVETPAEYKTVKKQVMVKPPTRRTVKIPAEYKTMKVRTLISPAKQRTVEVPASYQAVTKTVKTSEGEMEWRRILCETNVNRDVIRKVQTSLSSQGLDPGPVDGQIGPRTTRAIQSFQRKNNLAVGGLTYETMERLNIKH